MYFELPKSEKAVITEDIRYGYGIIETNESQCVIAKDLTDFLYQIQRVISHSHNIGFRKEVFEKVAAMLQTEIESYD